MFVSAFKKMRFLPGSGSVLEINPDPYWKLVRIRIGKKIWIRIRKKRTRYTDPKHCSKDTGTKLARKSVEPDCTVPHFLIHNATFVVNTSLVINLPNF